jgi:PAS domain S-box-containing protein
MIMPSFGDLPIKQKLLVAILVTSGGALLLSGAAIMVWDQYLFRQGMQRDLSSVADIVADNSQAALAFEDPQSARQTLSALKAKPHVVSACTYRADGTILAQYSRTGAAAPCPPMAPRDGSVFEPDGLRLTRSILLNGRRIGGIALLYDLDEIDERLILYGATVTAVLLLCVLTALILSTRLRQRIARPILDLADTAQSVSRTRDYGVRAQKLSSDETGELVDAFNEMLGTIQSREADLSRARDELEERVQRRTEELRHSEERFRLLVENVQDYAIFMLDPSGHVSTWNVGAQRIKGYRAEEIIGKHFEIFHPVEDRDKAGRLLQVAAATGGTEDEGWRVRKDGSRFWANVVIAALRDPQGRLAGFTKVVRDLTEQRKAQEALKQQAAELARSNADLQQFAYVASHDLQEPLRMVISYMQILSDQYKGKLDADADECIGFAVEGAVRMRQLIVGLLAYSRLSTTAQPLVQTDLMAVLNDVQANLDVAINESGAVITTDPLPSVLADPLQMGQLFQNLIGNAITFRGEKPPRIHVAAKLEESSWLFSVSDNGIGIQPEHYERIFVIFQRLHDRMQYKGTGIGLAICKKIVDRRGGRIWVESRPGQGSTFFFTIPIFPPQV